MLMDSISKLGVGLGFLGTYYILTGSKTSTDTTKVIGELAIRFAKTE